jgi:predicted Zn-dependent protease
MKKLKILIEMVSVFFSACATNPLTGERAMAFVPNAQLFAMAAQEYDRFLAENVVVSGTPEALTIERVGWRLVDAAERWIAAQGRPGALSDFDWRFTLIEDDAINAWAMPGGKIVFYTGILPVAQNEAGIAVIMGHEIAHAVLNHGQQRMSAAALQEMGAAGLSLAMAGGGLAPETQAAALTAFGVGSALFGTLPFSRAHEDEADHLGLLLMAIAGYDPEEAVALWERMDALFETPAAPQWLSTHPSHPQRIANLQSLLPEARRAAVDFGAVPALP